MPNKNFSFIKNSELITFSNCGLDSKRNCLKSQNPKGKFDLQFDSLKECQSFLGEVLYRIDSNYCGIFVICNDGTVIALIKNPQGDGSVSVSTIKMQTGEYDFSIIGFIAIESKMHIYGLVVETDKDRYKIIER